MATLTVRVAPRSSRPGVGVRDGVVVVRVAAPPTEGRATEEARVAVAHFLGVPRSAVQLRSGARSRTKVFEIRGISEDDVAARTTET